MSDQSQSNITQQLAPALPRPWETPRLSSVGNVAEILQAGMAKISQTEISDPGEPRKVRVMG